MLASFGGLISSTISAEHSQSQITLDAVIEVLKEEPMMMTALPRDPWSAVRAMVRCDYRNSEFRGFAWSNWEGQASKEAKSSSPH